MKLTHEEIRKAINATYEVEPASTEASINGNVSWDSRDISQGDVYIALPGERVDGCDFVTSAIEAGAQCAVVSHVLDEDTYAAAKKAGASILLVQDSKQAIYDLAQVWRSHIQGTVVGITGSTGKTTTKDMITAVLSAKGSCISTLQNQNNEIGAPRTILRAESDTDYVAVEMGMRGKGQIEELCKCVQPNWGLITNIGESHIELLGSCDEIAHAKAELFNALPNKKGVAFINMADSYAFDLTVIADLDRRGITCVGFDGVSGARERMALSPRWCYHRDPAVWAESVSLDDTGCASFKLCAHDFDSFGFENIERVNCKLSVAGVHNVSNACSAAAVGHVAGLTLEECAAALQTVEPSEGRQKIIHTDNGITVIDDAYNANPDSVRAAIDTFCAYLVPGRRIAVLGDMGELGDYSLGAHMRIGTYVANQMRAGNLDGVLCVGKMAKEISEEAIHQGITPSLVPCVDTTDEAVELLKRELHEDDGVLVKASHFMEFNRIVEGLTQ